MNLKIELSLLSLFLFIQSSPIQAQEQSQIDPKCEKRSFLRADNIEEVHYCSPYKMHRIFGYVARKNTKSTIVKFKDGKEFQKSIVTIDQNGFRTSSASHKKNKKYHLLLIGSSAVFGEDVDDEETLAHFLNSSSQDYEAYPLAFYGYGPQHAWLSFKSYHRIQTIEEKKGRAFIFVSDDYILRYFGTLGMYVYAKDFPRLHETQKGQFSYEGSFQETAPLWVKFLIHTCFHFQSCTQFASKISSGTPTREQIETVGRLIEDIERLYRSRFEAQDFTVLFNGTEETYKILKDNKALKIHRIDTEKNPQLLPSLDRHPSADYNQYLSEYLKEMFQL